MKTLRSNRVVIKTILGIVAMAAVLISLTSSETNMVKNTSQHPYAYDDFEWQPPGLDQLIESEDYELIRYGRDLVAYTSFYLGPKGVVKQISNGMNCQNCHLDAGTRMWANNFSGVASTYPKFRERSGSIENMYRRVNDCFERSLNAEKGLDTNSREMQAMVAYMKWLGKDVPAKTLPIGVAVQLPVLLERPADPLKGKQIYAEHCTRCHGSNGEGAFNVDSTMYLYPPLWGDHSYTTAAGLYRLTRLAGFVRHNMPFDAPAGGRQLTDEEAWDVAAFINSQPRAHKFYKNDWPDVAGKPYDFPFGPFADSLSETQHKFGPWR